MLIIITLLLLIGAIGLIGQLSVQLEKHGAGFQQIVYAPQRTAHFLSIHIPTCSEPPDMVIATLRSILAQDYPSYEVIVLDNNTSDPALWRPVKNFCTSHARLRFVHRAKLPGYKAGALNLALRLTDPRASHVLTVDADYQLLPGALELINRLIGQADGNTGLLQFPQAYRNTEGRGFEREYAQFFDAFLDGAACRNNALGTGTLSCLNLSALKACGGWPTGSITEDAALGMRLTELGWKGIFVNRVVGRGLMPTDVGTHFKQRIRWMYGNAQVIYQHIGRGLSRSAIVQLTAWINPLAPFILAHALLLLLGITRGEVSVLPWAVLLSGYAGYAAGRYYLLRRVGCYSRIESVDALLVHLNYLWIGAFCWWGVVWGKKKPFVRSCKTGRESQLSELPWYLPALMLLSACLLWPNLTLLGGVALLLTGLLVWSRIHFWRQIHRLRSAQLDPSASLHPKLKAA